MMPGRKKNSTMKIPFLLAPVALLALLIGSVESWAAPTVEGTVVELRATECEATFRPGEVGQAPEPVVVMATLSEEIGEVQEAVVEPGSGVEIVRVEARSPRETRVTFGTEGAQGGSWTVTFTGEGGVCTGELTVSGGSGPVSH